MNSIYNKAILGSAIAFFAYQASVFSQNQSVVFPKINGSSPEMDTSEVLEISGRISVKKLPEVPDSNPGNGHGQGINWAKKYYFVIADSTGNFFSLQLKKFLPGKPILGGPPACSPFTTGWQASGSSVYLCPSYNNLGINNSSPDHNSKLHIIPATPSSNYKKGIFIETPILNDIKGSVSALEATGGATPGSFVSTVEGTYIARIGFTSAFDAAGSIIGGVFGYVKPKHIESSHQTKEAFATGTTCIADLDDLTIGSPNFGKEWVSGMYAELRGTILEYPKIGLGAIAAVIGIDKIKQFDPSTGQHTYAGFFDGKVQIGNQTITSGPHTDALLFVDGKIVAKRTLTTQVNWADDELKKDLSLEEDLVEDEKYKDNYGHLQGVKSGKVIEKEGLDLAEMDATQMRLIERVFLYLFKFNKVVQELKAAIFEIKKDNRQMKKSNKKLEKENKKLKEGYAGLERRVDALEKNVE